MFRNLLSIVLLATLGLSLGGHPYAQQIDFRRIPIEELMAPWRAYYDSLSEWPRQYGWKAYKRMEWDLRQRAFPTGEIPAGAIWEAYQNSTRMHRATLDEPWVNLGAFNHGGRGRFLRFHPDHPNIMFAGSVGGGLFKSVDSGNSWVPITDHLPNIAAGCLEIDPHNPGVMYLGTGEGYPNIDAIKGIGLLKSTDGGFTWSMTGISYQYSAGQSINKLNIDPRNTEIILAATSQGMKRSTNGGQTFTTVQAGDMKELVRDPVNLDVLLCSACNPWGSGQNGIYRSTDNGVTWTRVTQGLPSVQNFGRAVLSFYPANTQVVYAGISGTFSYNSSGMIGVYRSMDNGISWTRMSADGVNHYSGQGWYDMAIAVKPDNPSVVFSSGVDCWKSVNSGGSWQRISVWSAPYGAPNFVHADHHEIVFHPENPEELWINTDGGVFRSTNAGSTWTEMNNGFVTFQYYAMGNATLDTTLAYGGMQDNGTFRYAGSPSFEQVFGGDGGYCVVDYTNNDVVYVEWQNGHRYRSDDGGRNFSDINPGITGDGPWVTPMVLDPFNRLVLYTTTADGWVWRSPNQGRSSQWARWGQQVGGSMQVLSASPAMAGRLYLGTDGSVYRYDTSVGQWQNVTGNLPGNWVTRVTPDPFQPNVVYVTVSGFGQGHVWKSTSAGTNWVNISGNLPDVPFQDVIVDYREPGTLYAGGDIGVYRTTNGGQSWEVFGEGLPAVRVDDMDLQPVSGVLRIATHGRGMWEVRTGGTWFALLYPNGGEILEIGRSVNINWSGASLGGTVHLEINRTFPSTDWTTLGANLPNTGTYNWLVTGPESQQVRFRITHSSGPGVRDTSNLNSRIAVPGLRLLRPNSGTLFAGVRDTIRFERVLVDEAVRVELNRDYPNGEWELIADNLMGNDAVWTVRLPASNNARIRVASQERDIEDDSDADLVLRAPVITLQAPNGGEQIPLGTAFNILWSAPEHQDNLRIQLNRNYPNGTWQTLASSTPNDGTHTWVTSGAPSTACRIRISTALDAQIYQESAADFALVALAAGDLPLLPASFEISEPYPNPFNPSTQIVVELPSRTRLDARVFNRLGQQVALLSDQDRDAGRHTFTFDGGDLPSGLYFIRVSAYGDTQILKAVMVK